MRTNRWILLAGALVLGQGMQAWGAGVLAVRGTDPAAVAGVQAIVREAVAADPEAFKGATEVTLVHEFDAVKLSRNYGEAKKVAGSQAEKALVGGGGSIMMWGPYDKLDRGQYVIIYRFQEMGKPEGDHTCFLDVSSSAVTVSGKRPPWAGFGEGVWRSIPVALTVKKELTVEYRFWPEEHLSAVDRVYVLKVGDGAGEPVVSPQRGVPGRPMAGRGPGLTIQSARYGAGGQWQDVTEKLQGMVKNDALVMTVGDALGDPAPDMPKTLRVRYWDGAAMHSVTVAEHQVLNLHAAVPGKAPAPGAPSGVSPTPSRAPAGAGGGSTVGISPTGAFEISVPSGAAPAAATTMPSVVDPNAIERLAYENAPKALVKSVTSVTAMTVITTSEGDEYGQTSDIIATVDPESRRSDQSGIGFYRPDGDEMMKQAFQEAVRAVRMRYPIWEPGQIDISFGEKFDSHAGPSAGTAFALLALSTLEGFEIDPKCAVTGDITVDWRVRDVGGIAAKVRGAALDKCLYAAIPEGNEAAIPDMALLNGESSLWGIQIFSIATLQDAVAIARRDRSPQLTEAIKDFAALQVEKQHNPGLLGSPSVQEKLKKILELASNHLSAKYLLESAEGNQAQELSLAASEYYTSLILSHYTDLFSKGPRLGGISIPAHLTESLQKRLGVLRPIINKDLKPLFIDVSLLVNQAQYISDGRGDLDSLRARMKSIESRLAAISMDQEMMEKLIREGF
jgi:hypothetical protein